MTVKAKSRIKSKNRKEHTLKRSKTAPVKIKRTFSTQAAFLSKSSLNKKATSKAYRQYRRMAKIVQPMTQGLASQHSCWRG